MKAYVYGANGPEITDVARPVPKGTQVLVKVHACGLNRADLGMTKGHAHGAAVGVGTVLTAFQLQSALAAGAEFFVTPICRPELVPLAHAAGRPIMLGAYTPTEAQLAHEAGADFVKLFPADNHGPKGVRAFRAPLPHLRIVPTGGVTLANAGEFIKAGCVALGVGSTLITAEILSKNDWPALRKLAADYVAAVKAAR